MEIYQKKLFSIDTSEPSQMISDALKEYILPKNFKVLDLGCGNGRNSIYLAKLGAKVDSVDIVDLNFKEYLLPGINKNISFHKVSVTDFHIKPNEYTFILASRLIQYLPKSDINSLLSKIKLGLISQGLAFISYTSAGGIFNQSEIAVPKFHHSINEIKNLIRINNLRIIKLEDRSGLSTHTQYISHNKTHDIIISR